MSHLPFTFASLLEPFGVEEFLGEYSGKREWIHHGPPSRFDGLLSWRTLNTLIRDHRPSAPRFRLMKAGHPLPEGAYHRMVQTLRGPLRLLDPARMLAELRAGATLVWDAIDQVHPPIRRVKQMLERALNGFVFINMYASWGTTGGVGDHWDDHDVFVLQLTGRKNWRVHPATRPWPMPEDLEKAKPPAEYAHDWTLTAGDVMYLPRGWWHRVTPVDEPSLHLTVGVLKPTNVDFLGWVLNRAKETDLVRQDLPSPMDAAGRAAHAAALRAALDQWIQPSSLELYERVRDATHYVDPRPTLQAVATADADAWEQDAEAVLLSTRAQLQPRSDGLSLIAAGKEWRAASAAEPVLRDLVDGRAVRVGTLIENLGGSLVSQLVTAGILAII